MRILAAGRLCRWSPNWREYLGAEARVLWEWHAAGLLRQAHYGCDWRCAILLLECRSLAEATQLLRCLPSSKAGLLRFEAYACEPMESLAGLFLAHHQPMPWWVGELSEPDGGTG